MVHRESEPDLSPIDLPEPFLYRVKNVLLGPPLHTERLANERLGKPTALAVFASDNLSSCAYATEEILRVLIPIVGLAAFSMVVPITVALLVVLAFLILSYRQTIKAYPSAGGAYIVTRDNFGLLPAQVAGVALLTDYVLTVSVSVAAGTAALTSAIHSLTPYSLEIAVGFVLLIAYINLRGVKESGRVLAGPVYFFIANMVALLGLGLFRLFSGHLTVGTLHHKGLVHVGSPSTGLFYGATLFVVLHAFGSGGAAVTGVEAISNGVPAFREPAWRNARTTLVIMGSTLGAMFLGLSILAAKVHAAPYKLGTPTVISQVGKLVFGGSPVGHFLFYSLQISTMAILVLAANTSFADFPRLASFHAGDNFMPHQLTKRGHRLVFSNGIIFLAVAGIVTLFATNGKVDRLIPLYAIGVFTSFTLSQAGMAKHHIKKHEPGWKMGLLINGIGATLSLLVLLIVAVTKFTHGAWSILIVIPIMVALLVRLNRQYTSEAKELERDAPKAAEHRVLRHHVVFILIDQLDLASARAVQYARVLNPDVIRAVHFDVDPIRTEDLTKQWRSLGLSELPLDIIDCPDRRLARSSAELVAEQLANGETEVTVLLPRREYSRLWHRLVHDHTADAIASALIPFPHCNVTIIPYHLGKTRVPEIHAPTNLKRRSSDSRPSEPGLGSIATSVLLPTVAKISDIEPRVATRVGGRIRSVRVQPLGGVPALECRLIDASGSISVVFMGRREIPGMRPGARLMVEGIPVEQRDGLVIFNPEYHFIQDEGPNPRA